MRTNQGFTLIEVILSIAIIGIIAVAFLPIFTWAAKIIFSAGNRTDMMFDEQKPIEDYIANSTSSNTNSLEIKFYRNDGTIVKNINVQGEEIANSKFRLFMPHK